MTSTAEIKYEFNSGRNNPAAVFETMANFVSSYTQLVSLLAEASGQKDGFALALDEVQAGSIIGRLKGFKESVGSGIGDMLFSSANRTIAELREETITEKQVDLIAQTTQRALMDESSNDFKIEPYISRRGLAEVLRKLSDSNTRLQPGELVKFALSNEQGRREVNLDQKWRFLGNPSEMFLEDCRPFDGNLRLSVKMPVNEGKSAWTFRRRDNEQTFTAHIEDSEWLAKYQASKLGGISAKDVMDARVRFDCCQDSRGKYTEIRNARIVKVINIDRYSYRQNSLDGES